MLQGTDIEYLTNNMIKRSFKLIKKIYTSQQYELFIGKCNQNKQESERVLKFQQFITKDEQDFITSLMEYQKSSEEQSLPSQINKIEEIFNYNNMKVTVLEKGIELSEYLQSKKQLLEKNEKEQICLDLSYSIEYLHKKSFMHLDLKPESFQKIEEKFKLSEFNQLRKFQNNQLQFLKLSITNYSAPEILQNQQKITDRADIWSLGCLFFEIFDGHPLFDINSIENLKKQQEQNCIYQKIESHICHPILKDLLKKMLIINPENRISILEVRSQLQNILYNQRLQRSKQIQNIDNNQPIKESNTELEFLVKRYIQEMFDQFKQEIILIIETKIQQEIQKQSTQQYEIYKNKPLFDSPMNEEIKTLNQKLFQLSPNIMEKINILLKEREIKVNQQIEQLREEINNLKNSNQFQNIQKFQNSPVEFKKLQQNEMKPANFPGNNVEFDKTINKQGFQQCNQFNMTKTQFQVGPPINNLPNNKINTNPMNFQQEKKQ